MKKTLVIIILAAMIPALALVSLAVITQHSRNKAAQPGSVNSWNLGSGSIRFDHATAFTTTSNIAAALEGQALPTNQWWGNALTGDWPETLFNLPWATKISVTGLAAGAPTPVVSADQIATPFTPDLLVTPTGSTLRSAKIVAHDDISVTLDVQNTDGQAVYTVRLIKGTPFMYVTLHRAAAVSAASGSLNYRALDDGRTGLDVTVAGREYSLYLPVGADPQKPTATSFGLAATDRDVTLTLAALPVGAGAAAKLAYDGASAAIITGGSVAYAVDGSTVRTSITYKTTGTGEPLYAVLPHQTGATSGKTVYGSMPTIRGAAQIVRGTKLTYSQTTPTTADAPAMPTDDTFFQKATLEAYLQKEVTTLADPAATSYNGGKELFRLANLLMVAEQSGSPTAGTFRNKLRSELVNWYTYTAGEADHYLYYDAKVHGLVAVTPEFGSELFNDHHFHYGYFLYASSVLGRYDAQFVQNYGPVVTLLARDIANTDRSDSSFPYLRGFDAYEGHSWADGVSRFADGNNQESVSEAVNAWYGLMLWGKVSKNDALAKTGQWLYTNETTAALTYYYNNASNPFPAGYNHHQISLLWGGKAVWQTFFSNAPEAKHGILMLPISGGSLYLNAGGNVAADLSALSGELGGKAPSSWQDTLGMVGALADAKAAQASFNAATVLDNSNSLPFYYYWLGYMGQKGSGS